MERALKTNTTLTILDVSCKHDEWSVCNKFVIHFCETPETKHKSNKRMSMRIKFFPGFKWHNNAEESSLFTFNYVGISIINHLSADIAHCYSRER